MKGTAILHKSGGSGVRGLARGAQPIPARGNGVQRAGSRSRARFQPKTCEPSWAPSDETIDEGDRRKADAIRLRFAEADQDHNGRIDRQELRALLEARGPSGAEQHMSKLWLTDGEVERVMSRYDLDRSGDLTYDEFEHLMYDGLLLDGKLGVYEAAFKSAADAGGGAEAEGGPALRPQQLRSLLRGMGSPLAADEARVVRLIAKYDTSGTGRLDLTGFMRLMKDHMLDVSQVLAYMGARQGSPRTTQTVIDAIAPPGEFTLIGAEDELDHLLAHRPSQLVVLMAGTTFCGSCRAMMSPFRELAAAYRRASFGVLFGDASDAAKALFRDRLKVRSTPAFFLFRDGVLVGAFAGGNVGRLEAEVRGRLSAEDLPDAPVYGPAAASYL